MVPYKKQTSAAHAQLVDDIQEHVMQLTSYSPPLIGVEKGMHRNTHRRVCSMQCTFALIAAVIVPNNQSVAQAQNVVPRETAVASQAQVLSIRNVTVRLDIPDASFRAGTAELTAWDDWVMVHEMVHLALPEVGRRHPWLAEGVATYVEGIARVQAGNRTVDAVWAELVNSIPQGLPKAGDAGLDNTHTWGRTYWGRALFCLLARARQHRLSPLAGRPERVVTAL